MILVALLVERHRSVVAVRQGQPVLPEEVGEDGSRETWVTQGLHQVAVTIELPEVLATAFAGVLLDHSEGRHPASAVVHGDGNDFVEWEARERVGVEPHDLIERGELDGLGGLNGVVGHDRSFLLGARMKQLY